MPKKTAFDEYWETAPKASHLDPRLIAQAAWDRALNLAGDACFTADQKAMINDGIEIHTTISALHTWNKPV